MVYGSSTILSGVNIKINGVSVGNTDSNGTLTYRSTTQLGSAYTVIAYLSSLYSTETVIFTSILVDTASSIYLKEAKTFNITVIDDSSNLINNAQIYFPLDGVSYYTNSSGVAIVTRYIGNTYNYTITHTGHYSKTITGLAITADTTDQSVTLIQN